MVGQVIAVIDATGDAEELLTRVKGGDRDALAILFSQHRDRLVRIIRFRLSPRLERRVDAEDILQEVYLDAEKRIKNFTGDSDASFFIWLRLVAGQTLIDVHRRHLCAQARDAAREVPVDGRHYPQATSTSLAFQLAANRTSPSQAAIREELSSQLEEAIGRMDPVDQEILALRHFEELTNSEVAEVLGIQQKAASIRYVRALGRLKQILIKLPDFAAEEPPRDAETPAGDRGDQQ
jgi:RNA polymerase sigma-70 factor, ECF subfamily